MFPRPSRHGVAAVALAMLFPACTADHGAEGSDAAPLDAALVIDAADVGHDAGHDAAAAPDAFCPDLDGDGAADAACGGDDCDDADPAVGPARSTCVGPVTLRRCVGASRVDEDCASSTPDCDARIGACAVSACGDHVVQPDEQCDGTDCLSTCERWCFGDAECASLPTLGSCIPMDGSASGVCAPATPGGAPFGAPCEAHTDCASSWCGPDSGRCTGACTSDRPGPVPMSWCSLDEGYPFTPGGPGHHDPTGITWHFTCDRESDCTDGRHCTVVSGPGSGIWMVSATCLPTLIPGGSPLGTPCSTPSSAPTCDSNTCLGGICTVPCLTDADCPAPLAHCADYDFTTWQPTLMQLWPAPRICTL